jgi:hypothetical protein
MTPTPHRMFLLVGALCTPVLSIFETGASIFETGAYTMLVGGKKLVSGSKIYYFLKTFLIMKNDGRSDYSYVPIKNYKQWEIT